MIKMFEEYNSEKGEIMDILNIATDEGLNLEVFAGTDNVLSISLYKTHFIIGDRIMTDEKFIKIVTEIRDRLRNEGYLKRKENRKERKFLKFFKKIDTELTDDISIKAWSSNKDTPWKDQIGSTRGKYLLLDDFPFENYNLPEHVIIHLDLDCDNLIEFLGVPLHYQEQEEEEQFEEEEFAVDDEVEDEFEEPEEEEIEDDGHDD